MSAGVSGAVVFSDIVGFTELTDLHGDDVALELVDAHARTVAGLLPECARVVKELGDGLLLWFGDAADAIRTGIALQERCASVHGGDLPLWVRVGIHWGCPRRRGDDLIGHDVNLTSRITALAGPGEVLCSEAVVAAAGQLDGVELRPLGSVFVKGVAEPVPLVRVQRRSS
ncbi:MAG: adenylate/guanylate cyclase domain-containing protein [Ilumatobacteraceae bacterium]|jgi:adenylate cyclase|nr:adenylate/guanylate cyclase domain-containing protein [Ilumatobacteraceae bacterium]